LRNQPLLLLLLLIGKLGSTADQLSCAQQHMKRKHVPAALTYEPGHTSFAFPATYLVILPHHHQHVVPQHAVLLSLRLDLHCNVWYSHSQPFPVLHLLGHGQQLPVKVHGEKPTCVDGAAAGAAGQGMKWQEYGNASKVDWGVHE
jgi:hypothetical protein